MTKAAKYCALTKAHVRAQRRLREGKRGNDDDEGEKRKKYDEHKSKGTVIKIMVMKERRKK